jgi:hypothetical protein
VGVRFEPACLAEEMMPMIIRGIFFFLWKMLLRELTIDQAVRFVTFKAGEDLRDRTRL